MRLPLILGIIGLVELVEYLRNHSHHASGTEIGALPGSLVVAGVFGAIRAATIHLWMQDGQPWRLIMRARAQRLPMGGGGQAGSFTGPV
jgi:hypothetical protein